MQEPPERYKNLGSVPRRNNAVAFIAEPDDGRPLFAVAQPTPKTLSAATVTDSGAGLSSDYDIVYDLSQATITYRIEFGRT